MFFRILGTTAAVLILIASTKAHPTNQTELEPRAPQIPGVPASCSKETYVVGDGNPHQDKYHQQITDHITCAQRGSGSTGDSKSYSVSVGFSIGSGAGGSTQNPLQWVSGGFNVQESWSQTQSISCSCDTPGDVMCLWHRLDHTAYTVYTEESCPMAGTKKSDPFVIRSPNSDDYDNGFYCVIGTCRNKGDSYWDLGEAGLARNGD